MKQSLLNSILTKNVYPQIYLFALAGVLILFGSCQPKEKTENTSETAYQLEITDSTRIDYLGQVKLMDIHVADEKILLYNQKTRDFILADFKGNILKEINKTGDAPDSFGSFPLSPPLFGKGQEFTLLSYPGIYTYDYDGNLTKKIKYAEPVQFVGRASAEFEFFQLDDQILFPAVKPWGKSERNTPEFYEEYELLAWVDTSTGEVKSFMHLEENSIFKNGQGHEVPDMLPILQYHNERIYMVVGKDKHLNVYESQAPYGLIYSKELPLQGFQQNPGIPLAKIDPKAIMVDVTFGRITNLKVNDDHIVVSYFQGYKEEDREAFNQLKTADERNAFKNEIEKPEMHRLMVLDHEGHTLLDMPVPEKLDPQQFVLRGQNLYFLSRLNQEEEEDFWKIFQVKVTNN